MMPAGGSAGRPDRRAGRDGVAHPDDGRHGGMFNPAMLPAAQRPAGWRIAVLALLIVAMLAMAALWVASEYRRGAAARETLVRSYERRILIADLMSGLKDAETGQRGYLMSGDPEYLEPYSSAAAQIADRRRRIEALLIAVPEQTARYRRLGGLIDTRLAALRTALADRTGPYAGRRVRDNRGNETMEAARSMADLMMREEDRMIAVRHARGLARATTVQRHVWTLAGMLAALLCGGLVLAWMAARTRYRLQIETREAVARLRGVFAATGDGIALVDADGAIEAVNPAVTAMLGHARGALIGQDLARLVDVLPPGDTLEARLALIDGRLAEPVRLDRVAHHVDGHDVPVDVALGLMPTPSGLHLVAAIRDISARKGMERLKDEFVATVSHELRTPLTSIVGALGLLRGLSGATLPEPAQRLLQVAEQNAQRLIDLVGDLLDLERMEAGGLSFRMTPIDLAAVVRQAVQASEGLAAVKGVRIALSVAAGGLPVSGDAGRLAQVATNLLANAVRFSPDGGTVTVTIDRRDGRAVVTVADRGPGVPPGFRDQLFTRFAQSDAGGAAGGTGLGLAISRQIMRAHGGTIAFAPREGGGACFRFAIGLRGDDGQPPHVLVCAAVPAVAAELRTLAEAGGCSADALDTVAAAQAAIRAGGYDAVMICLDGRGQAGPGLLAALTGAARDGRLAIPVAARIGGAIRAGVAADRDGWPPVGQGGGLAARIRILQAEPA